VTEEVTAVLAMAVLAMAEGWAGREVEEGDWEAHSSEQKGSFERRPFPHLTTACSTA
jgi:hypothetical protein